MNAVMIQALLRILSAIGVQFDPVMLAQWIATAQVQIPAFIVHVQARINAFDARLTAMEQSQARVESMLAALCEERGVDVSRIVAITRPS